MRHLRYVTLLLVATIAIGLSAKTKTEKKAKERKQETVYVCGMATSFSDSIVYFTDIQRMEKLTIKKGLLTERSELSYQLYDFIEREYSRPHYTAVTFFDTKEKRINKKIEKLIAKYKKTKGLKVLIIEKDNFKYHDVSK